MHRGTTGKGEQLTCLAKVVDVGRLTYNRLSLRSNKSRTTQGDGKVFISAHWVLNRATGTNYGFCLTVKPRQLTETTNTTPKRKKRNITTNKCQASTCIQTWHKSTVSRIIQQIVTTPIARTTRKWNETSYFHMWNSLMTSHPNTSTARQQFTMTSPWQRWTAHAQWVTTATTMNMDVQSITAQTGTNLAGQRQRTRVLGRQPHASKEDIRDIGWQWKSTCVWHGWNLRRALINCYV